ncbi:MAG: efflux RND transporter permease subunit [Bryobacterales bacterium]|nr:efflux RND transporter permease subunit [Bryobacterales bacterium]
MNPIRASLRYPVVTYTLVLMAMGVGLYALFTMPRREDPKITIRTGIVAAFYPGATAEQVESQVTAKIEEHLFRVPEVRKAKTFSTSRTGAVVVNVELEDNVRAPDVVWSKLRQDLNVLAATELPQGVRGPVVDSDFGDTVAVLIAVHGEKFDYRELKEYAERIESEFRKSRAVTRVRRYGEQQEEILISSSLERLSQYAVNPMNIIGALRGRNSVEFAGTIDTPKARVPLQTTGLFQTESQIRRVMIDVSPSGQPVYIGDLAEVTRGYKDPEARVRYKGERAVMLSVEMQEGHNIVAFGDELRARLATFRSQAPPDLYVDLVADQPEVVHQRIGSFFHEFGIALTAVILVTVLLLPFRVAMIAAIAIPLSVAVTFATMNAFGIELHQVSIAALIVVLGMVVDDAIVIADNYVALLDQGLGIDEAAGRCASQLAVPVLTATLTIIAAFLPLLLLSGAVGEFISALPYAVSIALCCSFLVAMLLTPLLCRRFIHQGLRAEEEGTGAGERPRSRIFSPLDVMQAGYGRMIVFAMGHKLLAVLLGVGAVCGGFVLLRFVPEQFFPLAERNQFVVDLWMPEGTRLEATEAAMKKLEELLARNPGVRDATTFTGFSAPRFYYNVNPQPNTRNYGQILVNTVSEEETAGIVAAMRESMPAAVPGALVMVKQLQQGNIMEAPIEVRISGSGIEELKGLAVRVESILRDQEGSIYVHNDYRNDAMQLRVDVKEEIANRLGISNDSIARQLAGAFEGAPVTTYWEGDRDVDVVLRLEESRRTRFENVSDAYITSRLTGARVPLDSIASLQPVWEHSRIVRRNGVRTVTVRAFAREGVWASKLLSDARRRIDALPLPDGYAIQYGGELENQQDTFAEMIHALMISIVAIFLILLLQFRTVSEPLVVMTSIPLALPGAALGLILTGNPFGFTAFMGIVSLSGIVVRNAIILVEEIHVHLANGADLESAAREAGERRLRPIFLTTMAAAVGVTPMILSGSSLWSPLASVIAVGLIFSMFFTLGLAPVLYVLVERRRSQREAMGSGHRAIPVSPMLGLLLAASILLMPLKVLSQNTVQPAPEGEGVRELTVDQAVAMALRQNAKLRMAEMRVEERATRVSKARSNYFPHFDNQSNLLHTVNRQNLTVPAGSLGEVPGLGQFPLSPIGIPLGNANFFLSQTTVRQPITQWVKIRKGEQAAREDQAISAAEAARARSRVALKVKEVYFGILIAEARRQAFTESVTSRELRHREVDQDVVAGVSLDVARMQEAVQLLEARQAVLTADQSILDLRAELNNLVGLDRRVSLKLIAPAGDDVKIDATPESLEAMSVAAPETGKARHELQMAQAAAGAARAEYIPDLGFFAQHIYQNGVPLLPGNNGVLGLQMDVEIFGFGKRRADLRQRRIQVELAEVNLRDTRERVRIDLETAARKVERAGAMRAISDEAAAIRGELLRLARNQLEAGLVRPSAVAEAEWQLAQAKAVALEADLQHRLAIAAFQDLAGRY